MASKNSRKIYSEDSFYHIYNRGVEKRLIFQDEQDYAVFLSYLRTYLLPKDTEILEKILMNPNSNYKEKDKALQLLRLNNFFGEITLIAYCLMPNHIHFLVHQTSSSAIDKLMNSLGVRYTMYFNKKYKRVGPLYQGVYKAALIESEPQLLYLSSYIHRNPLKNIPNSKLTSKDLVFRAYCSQPSSYPEYLGQRHTEWIQPEEILAHFSKTYPKLSYQSFVEQSEDLSFIQNIVLDI